VPIRRNSILTAIKFEEVGRKPDIYFVKVVDKTGRRENGIRVCRFIKLCIISVTVEFNTEFGKKKYY